jgi:hypothetical protein
VERLTKRDGKSRARLTPRGKRREEQKKDTKKDGQKKKTGRLFSVTEIAEAMQKGGMIQPISTESTGNVAAVETVAITPPALSFGMLQSALQQPVQQVASNPAPALPAAIQQFLRANPHMT